MPNFQIQPQHRQSAFLAGLIIVVSAGLAVSYLSFTRANGTYTVPSSIAADCSADVSAALESWIATVPNNSTISFPANKCYRAEKYIQLVDRIGLDINGNGSKIQRTQPSPAGLVYPKPNPHWWVLRGTGVTFRNMSISGTNTVSDLEKLPEYGRWYQPYEFEAGIRAERTATFRADNINVYAVYGDGIQLNSGTGAIITNVTVDKNGRQGISVQNFKNVLIDNAQILHSRRGGIDLENSGKTMSIDNVEIRNSTLSTWLLALPAGGNGRVDNIFFHHNTIKRTGVPVIENRRDDLTVRRTNWRIEDNVVTYGLGSTASAINMYHTDNVTIARNTLRLKEGRSGKALYFSDSRGTLIVRDNYFENALAAYSADPTSGAVMACSNKLTATGSFDQPIICPPPGVNPSPTPESAPTAPVNSPGATPVTSQEAPANTHASNNFSDSTGPASIAEEAAQAVIAAPADTTASLVAQVLNSKVDWWKRIVSFLAAYSIILIFVVLTFVLAVIILRWWQSGGRLWMLRRRVSADLMPAYQPKMIYPHYYDSTQTNGSEIDEPPSRSIQ